MTAEIFQVRASSFGTLFDCGYRWEGEHLLKLQRDTSLRAWLGTSIHASTAAFDQAKLAGAPISANDAADVFVESLWNPTEDVDLKGDPKLTLKQAELIGLTLHARYCAEIAPRMNFESVEMKLKPLDVEAEGVIIRLTGTMDRARVARVPAVNFPGLKIVRASKVIADLKTGGRGWDWRRGGHIGIWAGAGPQTERQQDQTETTHFDLRRLGRLNRTADPVQITPKSGKAWVTTVSEFHLQQVL